MSNPTKIKRKNININEKTIINQNFLIKKTIYMIVYLKLTN